MAWGAAVGAIAGGALSYMGSQDQADAARGATQAEIDFKRDKFEYARDFQQDILKQQEPRRIGSQRAMRSLSMMAGLGDPGYSAPAYKEGELSEKKRRLEEIPEQIPGPAGTYSSGAGDKVTPAEARKHGIDYNQDPGFEYAKPGQPRGSTEPNPEYQQLESEIEELENDLGGGSEGPGRTQFPGPRDITELPGYDFFQEQGLEALSRSGAASGMQLSGSQMKDITRFGQGHASKFRGQLIGELQSMAGMRPSSQGPAQNISALAGQSARSVGSSIGSLGAIGAAESAGKYGALGSTLNQLGQIDWSNTGTTGGQVGANMGANLGSNVGYSGGGGAQGFVNSGGGSF